MTDRRESALLCRVRGILCAVPVDHVEETMRPLAIRPIAGVPPFVRGLAIIRGSAVPVVDLSTLLGGTSSIPTRFVTVKAGERRVALTVDAVVGIHAMTADSFGTLPQLFHGSSLEAVSAAGALDAELLFVLHSTRLVPEDVWAAIAADQPA